MSKTIIPNFVGQGLELYSFRGVPSFDHKFTYNNVKFPFLYFLH